MWSEMASALADFAWKNMVNRTDRFGLYLADGSVVTESNLEKHNLEAFFAGKFSAGLHTTSPKNTCRWIAFDIDSDDKSNHQAENWILAERLVHAARQHDLRCLVEDSNGVDRYHVWIIFDRPVPSVAAYDLAEEIRVEAEALCEVFPKQPSLEPGQIGNWLRLPGKHPRRPHVSRFWDEEKRDWGGPEIMLEAPINEMRDFMLGENPPEPESEPGNPAPANLADLADVISALEAIPNTPETYEKLRTNSYDLWFKVVAALALYGDDAKASTLRWSEAYERHDIAAFERKWRQCQNPKRRGKVTGKTIIQIAQKHFGWKPKTPLAIRSSATESTPLESPPYASSPEELREAQAAAVARMNQTYAMLAMPNKAVVMRETPQALRYWDVRSFKSFVANEFVQAKVFEGKGRPEHRPISDFWISSRERRTYQGVSLSPCEEPPEGCYNLWTGWGVKPKKGDCHLYLAHLLDVVCSGVEEYYRYLLAWMADAVQNPGDKSGICVVMRGAQGAGKGMATLPFELIFGRHFKAVTNPAHVSGKFNAHLEDCLILFADEAYNVHNAIATGSLKALITNPTFHVEHKGINSYQAPNKTRIIMSSNNAWIVPAEVDDRRFFVLDVSSKRAKSTKYFAALHQEITHGGAAALLHTLLNHDFADIDVRHAPQTAALIDQKIRSAESSDQWWHSTLADGYILANQEGWPEWIDCEALYEKYIRDMQAARGALLTKIGFFMRFAVLCPNARKHRATIDGGRRAYGYLLPGLAACREAFCDVFGAVPWAKAPPMVNDDTAEIMDTFK